MIVTLILILACQIHGTKESLDISSIYINYLLENG